MPSIRRWCETPRRVLRAAGAETVPIPGATCCGQPAWNSGFAADARRVARRTLRAMADLDAVVVPSGSCTAMMRLHWPPPLPRRPRPGAGGARRAAASSSSRSTSSTSSGATALGTPLGRTVTYHDSCHMLRELRLHEQPRRLLRAVAELRELPRGDRCCGFGGTFSVRYPDVATAMADDKLASAAASGAETRRQRRPRLHHARRGPGGPHRRGRPRGASGDDPRGGAVSGFERRAATALRRSRPASRTSTASPSARTTTAPPSVQSHRLRGAARRRASGSAPRRSPTCRRCSTGCRRTSSETASSCTAPPRARTRPTTSPTWCSGTGGGGQGQVDGVGGDRPERAPGGGRGGRRRDRPRRVHRADGRRGARAHHHPGDPQEPRRRARAARAARRRSRSATIRPT